MDENKTEETNVNEAVDTATNEVKSETTNEAVKEAPKDSKEMAEKPRKIVGIILMVIGAIISVTMSAFAGVLILLGGMWAYNPEVKESGDSKNVPTWIGTLLIIAAVVIVAWLYNAFIA